MHKALSMLLDAGVPTLVWGPPGVGKTALIRALANKRRWLLVEIIASLHDPTDFNGLPVIQNGGVHFAPPEWVYQFEEGGQGILFLDELTTAPPTVQAALLRLVLERKVGAHSLPAGVRVVAAANPPEMAASGWELAPPLANRFAHLQFQLDAGEWVNHFPSYWGNPPQLEGVDEQTWARARARVAAFLTRRPNLLYTFNPDRAEETRFATPRTWDLFSRAWAAAHLDSAAAGDLAAALVGDAPAAEFASWVTTLDLREPAEILALGRAYRLPSRGDIAHAELTALAESNEAIESPESWERAWEVLRVVAQNATDLAALAAGRLLKRGRPLYGTPDLSGFTEFVSAIEEVVRQ
jgi:MoxR-like ATPase